MEAARIEEWWGQLEPGIQEWLMDNPGTVILPRTIVNAISATVHEAVDQEAFEVSEAARSFIRFKAEERRRQHSG